MQPEPAKPDASSPLTPAAARHVAPKLTGDTRRLAELPIDWAGAIPFILCHVAALSVFFVPQTAAAWITCLVLYVVRMFGVTAGYHRYFSHRAFRTSRVFQFVLAFLAQSSAQRGALWWAAHHRNHHKHSDQTGDVHSPVQDGFWHSHVG